MGNPFKVTPFAPEQHYAHACKWWRASNWTPMPLKALPTLGRVVLHNERPVCMGWIYRTDSVVALLEWVVADPEFREKPARSEALDLLVETLITEAALHERNILFCSLESQAMIARCERFGFKRTDRNMTNMVRLPGGLV